MNSETKLLVYTIGGFIALATAACAIEKFYSLDKNFCPLYCHIEIHADRPIEDVVKELERDSEPDGGRFERDCERDQIESDFDRMS